LACPHCLRLQALQAGVIHGLFPRSHFSVSAFQRFSVSAFQRFSVSAFQRFSVSAFQRFSVFC
jgi:hypothetical protein